VGPLSNLHRKARELLGLAPLAPADPLSGVAPVLPAKGSPGGPPGDPHPSPQHPAAPPLDQTVRFRPVRREELHSVIGAILSLPGGPAHDAQITEFLRQAPARRVDLSLLRVAERRGRLLWSVLPVMSPGRTALLLAPSAPHGAAEVAAAGKLVDLVCTELASRGVHLAQALLDPRDAAAQSLFAGCQFASMSELLYLTGEPRRRFVSPPLPPGLMWVPYSARDHELFKQTVAATYEGSLDCPALNGMREMDDVMAGHKASGEFEPGMWRLLCQPPTPPSTQPQPLGVLLLSRIAQASAIELVYLGLAPAARGRKLGDLLVKQALAGVIEQGMARLTLAVDGKNAPALKLYYRNGLSILAPRRCLKVLLKTRIFPLLQIHAGLRGYAHSRRTRRREGAKKHEAMH
jgi:mycothiol synthase